MTSVCYVCKPPTKIITASFGRGSVTLDAVPHSAGLYAVSRVNGWDRAIKIRRDDPPGNLTRHRIHIHRTERRKA